MRHPFLLMIAIASVLAGSSLGICLADERLDAVVENLGSSSVSDRVNAVRDLGRMGLEPKQARPILEKMVKDPVGTVRVEVAWLVPDLLGESGADLLETLYNDPERSVRDAAIRGACSMFDKTRPRDLCIVASEDPDHSARVDVIGVLKERFPRDKQAALLFRKALDDPSELVQRAAVFGCQAARDEKAVDRLYELAMNAPNHVALPVADEALATIASPKAVDYLVKMLQRGKGEPGKPARPTDEVRAASARALARIKDPRSLPALRGLINDPVITVRIGAMGAVLEMKDKTAVPLVVKQLKDEDERVRRFALRTLRVIGDESAADAVRETLRSDKEVVVRATAVSTLADMLGEDSIPDLEAQSKDLDSSVRLEVAGALTGLGVAAAPALSKLVKDASPEVRAIAIEGLGQIGGQEQIPALVKAAANQDRANRQVRIAVAGALGRIGHPDGLKPLVEFAKDKDPAIRQRAAHSLGQIGGELAKKTLETLVRDKVARVRNTARRELDKLKK